MAVTSVDLRLEQLLLGVQHVEDGAGADALLGAGAFERELVGLNRDGVRLDRLLRGFISGKGGAGNGDHRALGPDDLLQGLALDRLRLAGPGGGKAALENRYPGTEPGRRLRPGARARMPGKWIGLTRRRGR